VAYFLAIAAWAVALIATIFSNTQKAEVVEEPAAPVVAQLIVESEATEKEAVLNEFDPVRSDIPMDAEAQRLLYKACGETGIRYELALALIWQETDFRNIVGDGGESYGYMQVQPRWHSERMEKLGVTDLSDPYGNFLVGLDFLAELLERHDLTNALTAYNSGSPGNSQYAESVLNYMKILTTEDF
jgi:soluble lytic murein transglycosylase-like protein